MTSNSLQKLEQLVEAAPNPTEPNPGEEALQQQGDNPDTQITNLTVGELTALQSVDQQRLANTAAEDGIIRQREIAALQDLYIPKLYWMMVYWLVFVAAVVVTVGFFTAFGVVPLTDAVLIALITTTTATVLGIFIIVAKWLFPAPPDKK